MDKITEALLTRKQDLEKAIHVAEAFLKEAPDGQLRISSSHGVVQYYHFCLDQEDKAKNIYLPKSEGSIISQLAQKDYTVFFLQNARAELKAITKLLDKDVLFSSDAKYAQLPVVRKKMVKPYLTDNETYAYLWERKPYEPNPNHPENKKYRTKRGEMVRSKSEMIFADMFYDMGIPYKYECPILLKNGVVYHPDFTLLKKSTREVFFHEHLGRFDDPQYIMDKLPRFEEFRRNGIFFGKNLIVTVETEQNPPVFHELKNTFAQIFL